MFNWRKNNNILRHLLLLSGLVILPVLISGCAVIVKKAGNSFSGSLTEVILNHNDLATVREAMPAYMLLMDSFIRRHPESVQTYTTAATLYSAYAGLIPADDEARAERLSDKAMDYAFKALCLEEEGLCQVNDMPFETYETRLEDASLDTSLLFTVASTWAGWVQTNKSDWNAVAQLPKAKAMMEKVLQQDETYSDGQGHMYMGVLESLVPPAAGGDLEKAKRHFEKASTIADGENLMAKVLYAKNYARMMFDKELHQKLLNEVLEADPEAENLTLMNMAAQKRAEKLQESAQDYFE